MNKANLIAKLPPFKNKVELVTYNQGTGDIIDEIRQMHKQSETDYDLISEDFYTGDVYTTCNNIWDYLKSNLKYTIEGEDEQTVKTATAMHQKGAKIDCKHYSLFIAGILDSLKAKGYPGFENWTYRFAGYDGIYIEHVFVVLDPDTDGEIWIDPVLDYFDQHLEPYYYSDKSTYPTISGIFKISGVNTTPGLVNIALTAIIGLAAFVAIKNN